MRFNQQFINMKNISILFLLAILSACAFSRAPAGHGFFYTDTSEVIYYDPYIKPQQKATMCNENFMGFVSSGDASFNALKLNSGIRKIATMEKTYNSVLSVYTTSCLIVKGE